MGYIQKTLGKDEPIIQKIPLDWLHILLAWIWLILGVYPLMVIGIIVALTFFTMERAITNRRIITKWGIIARKTQELFLKKVETVDIDQGVIGRIFGYGTVVCRGTGMSEVSIQWVGNPSAVKRVIEEAITEAQQ